MIEFTLVRNYLDDIEFMIKFYENAFRVGIKYVRPEDIPVVLSIFKLTDVYQLYNAINNVNKQIIEASVNDFHDLIPYLYFKKKKWEDELKNLIKERLQFLQKLILKNLYLKKLESPI